MSKTLRPSKAPNIPIAPVAYDQRYTDQLMNAMRLYFNQVDNFSSSLMANDGGRFISFPHIAAQDTTSQYATGNNIPTIVKWDTLDTGTGFTLNLDNTATTQQSGIYKIDFSLQLVNTANVAEDVFVWLQVDGVNVPGSSSKFTVPARKSAGVPSYVVAYSSITFPVDGEKKIGLWWATPLAYNTVGPVDGVYMEAIPAITSPYARPLNPSAIGTITFVSALP